MKRGLWVLAMVTGASAIALPSAGGQPPALPTLPLVLTVATEEGRPVVTRAWLDAQVAEAGTLFASAGIRFSVVARDRIGEEHARLETRRDRHALGAHLRPGVVHAFFVRSLRDVDEPDRYRQGVHWRPRGVGAPDGAHLVIVSSIAGPTVLAHELGHYFSLGHSDTPGNVMSYEGADRPPFFDEGQIRQMRFRARRLIRRGELEPVD